MRAGQGDHLEGAVVHRKNADWLASKRPNGHTNDKGDNTMIQ
jgi:hypothetical protein